MIQWLKTWWNKRFNPPPLARPYPQLRTAPTPLPFCVKTLEPLDVDSRAVDAVCLELQQKLAAKFERELFDNWNASKDTDPSRATMLQHGFNGCTTGFARIQKVRPQTDGNGMEQIVITATQEYRRNKSE